jgi:hypothetical protein
MVKSLCIFGLQENKISVNKNLGTEVYFTEEINEELNQMYKDTLVLNELVKKTHSTDAAKQEQIQQIQGNVNTAHAQSVDAFYDTVEAAQLHSKNVKLKLGAGGMAAGGALGAGTGLVTTGTGTGAVAGTAIGAVLLGSIGGAIGTLVNNNRQKDIDKEIMNFADRDLKVDENYCNICKDDFSWRKNKHFCRVCGKTVCKKCSPNKVNKTYKGCPEPKSVRACKNCYSNNK